MRQSIQRRKEEFDRFLSLTSLSVDTGTCFGISHSCIITFISDFPRFKTADFVLIRGLTCMEFLVYIFLNGHKK